jgi:hypothetical protein
MPNDLEAMITRLTEMQEAVVTGSDAPGVAFYAQEATKYWLTHIDGFAVELESENLQIITYRITMTLVLEATTAGFDQEAEKLIQTWLPTVVQYFAKRRQLKRTSADLAVTGLSPKGALITGGKAGIGIVSSGIGQTQFGVDFNIEVPMVQDTNQVIF